MDFSIQMVVLMAGFVLVSTAEQLAMERPMIQRLLAWNAACGSSSRRAILSIPRGRTFLLAPTTFEGPCKTSIVHVQITGNLVGPGQPWEGVGDGGSTAWLDFSDVDRLIVVGSGQIYGRGALWWNRCPQMDNCRRPTSLRFNKCNGLIVRGLRSINSPRNHISVVNCHGVTFSKVTLSAPEDSPNTDGFDISKSSNVHIDDSFIGTGDDCVAINTGSSYINITGVQCGPGHGISIGSLGEGGSYETVEEVHVRHCTFKKTTNGARINN